MIEKLRPVFIVGLLALVWCNNVRDAKARHCSVRTRVIQQQAIVATAPVIVNEQFVVTTVPVVAGVAVPAFSVAPMSATSYTYNPYGQQQQQGYGQGYGQQQQTYGQQQQPPKEMTAQNVVGESVIESVCLGCHNAKHPSGNLDLSDLDKLSTKQYKAILNRVVTDDVNKRMPKGKPPLSLAQYHQLVGELLPDDVEVQPAAEAPPTPEDLPKG